MQLQYAQCEDELDDTGPFIEEHQSQDETFEHLYT